jgi:hypothetical protein
MLTLLHIEQLSGSFISILCFAIGILSSYQILAFTTINKIVTETHLSISMALLNMIIMLFGFIYHSLIGFILGTFFVSSTLDEFVYGADAYQGAFSVILVGIAAGVVGFWRMRE